MKRKAATFLLLLGLTAVAPAAASGKADFLRWLFKQGDDIAKQVNRPAYYDEAFRAIPDDVAARLSPTELAEFDAAAKRLFAKIPPRDQEEFFNELRVALSQTAEERAAGSTVQYSAEFPNLRVKVSGNPKHYRHFREFARERMQETLDRKFSIDDAYIVLADMGDSTVASSLEKARFSRKLPGERIDSIGPWAKPGLSKLSQRDIVKELAPYKNKTVLIVGHIPKDAKGFQITLPGGSEYMDIAKWSAAAKEANVNMVMLGCNSGRLQAIGPDTAINSAVVLKRLQEAIASKPRTIGEFYQKLTSEELRIAIDPVETQFFDNSAEIIARENDTLIARIWVAGKRVPPQAPVSAARLYERYDRLARPSLRQARYCNEDLDVELSPNLFASTLSKLTRGANENDEAVKEAGRGLAYWRRMTLVLAVLFAFALPLSVFLMVHGLIVFELSDAENDAHRARIFDRNVVRRTLGTFTSFGLRVLDPAFAGTGPRGLLPLYLSILGAFAFAPFYIAIVPMVVAALMVGIYSLVHLGNAYRWSAPALSLPLVGFVLWIGSASIFIYTKENYSLRTEVIESAGARAMQLRLEAAHTISAWPNATEDFVGYDGCARTIQPQLTRPRK